MNDLEAMSLLAKRNKNIKQSVTLLSAKATKKGGEITFGVDAETVNSAIRAAVGGNKHYFTMYAIPIEEFNAVKDLDYQTELSRLRTEISNEAFLSSSELVQPAETLLDQVNDIDTISNCANCGIEFHIHKSNERTTITWKEAKDQVAAKNESHSWRDFMYAIRRLHCTPEEKLFIMEEAFEEAVELFRKGK